jgi:hypothetical protein
MFGPMYYHIILKNLVPVHRYSATGTDMHKAKVMPDSAMTDMSQENSRE